jgi:predicted nucleic acid-binding protein
VTVAGVDVIARVGPAGPIVIDTSVLVAYLDGGDAFGPAAAILLDELVAPGTHPATVSAVTVTECLVHPFRAGPEALRLAATFLEHFPNLRVRVVDGDVATEAARIRALVGLRTPDALVLATAVVDGIGTVVTTDGGWRRAVELLEGVRLVELPGT